LIKCLHDEQNISLDGQKRFGEVAASEQFQPVAAQTTSLLLKQLALVFQQE